MKGPLTTNDLLPLSVVIPTYNRSTLLRETLRRCVANSGGVELELIIIDDGSTDNTPLVLGELQHEIPNLVWKRVPNAGPGQARNLGASIAKHEVILFLGDDIQPLNDDFFRVHSRTHTSYPSDKFAVLGKCVWSANSHDNISFVMAHIQGRGGEQFGYADLSPYTWLDWNFFYTSNISVKKKVLPDWLKSGFRREFTTAAWEDVELAYRLKKELGSFRIFYDPGSVGQHIHTYDVESFFNRQFNSGMMASVILELHPELIQQLSFTPIINALGQPGANRGILLAADYLSVIEGIKSFARIMDAKGILGRAAWHDDLLFAVFELAFQHGFITARSTMTSNFEAAYEHILDKCLQKLHRAMYHEITSYDPILQQLLSVARPPQHNDKLGKIRGSVLPLFRKVGLFGSK